MLSKLKLPWLVFLLVGVAAAGSAIIVDIVHYVWISASVCTLVFGGVAYWLTQRATSGTEKALSAILEVASGKPSGLADNDRDGGELTDAVRALETKTAEAQTVFDAANQARQAMVVCNTDFTIIFANSAAHDLVARSAEYWRKNHPGFDPANLLGASIDVFDQTQGAVRERLKTLSGDEEIALSFDGRKFAGQGSPMLNSQGEHQGFVLYCSEQTRTLAGRASIAETAAKFAQGDFKHRATVTAKDQGLRDSAAAFNAVGEVLEQFCKGLRSVAEAFAKGDLTQHMDSGMPGDLGRIATDLNRGIQTFESLFAQVKTASQAVAAATGDIAQGAQDLSSRAESQAASLEQTAATMEEMAEAVKASAKNAEEASGKANDASSRGERGQQVVTDAVNAMHRIEDSSSKIGEIITVIDSIAFQTNLLALNAAVEAARAGDAGKGFAVVASEVRTLAQRSSQAAKDINELIQESSGHVTDGVRLVQATGDALGEIVTGIGDVEGTISEISAAAREQSQGVEEITSAVNHMDEITQKNSSLAEQSASSAQLLNGHGDKLMELMGMFRVSEKSGDVVLAKAAPTSRVSSPSPQTTPKAAATVSLPKSVAVSEKAADKTWKAAEKPAQASKPAPQAKPAPAVEKPARASSPAPAAKPEPAVQKSAPVRSPAPAAAAAVDVALDDDDWAEF